MLGGGGGNKGPSTGNRVVSVKKRRGHKQLHSGLVGKWDQMPRDEQQANGGNKRSVWKVEEEDGVLRWLSENHPEIAEEYNTTSTNRGSVFEYAPARFAGEHFAVFPERLITDMIKAGCPEGGTVMDLFFGRGTTGVVAALQGKDCIGIEMVPNNIRIAERYIYSQLGFLADLEIISDLQDLPSLSTQKQS